MLLCLEDDLVLLCNVYVFGMVVVVDGGVWMVGMYGVLDKFDLVSG